MTTIVVRAADTTSIILVNTVGLLTMTDTQLAKPTLSRSVLRRGQASLYDLIVDKIENGDTLTLNEARGIWLTKVCRNIVDGKPHSYRYFPRQDGSNNWYGKYVPMDDDQVNFAVMNWLTKNIGILVMRGYLKVIPMIQLERTDG